MKKSECYENWKRDRMLTKRGRIAVSMQWRVYNILASSQKPRYPLSVCFLRKIYSAVCSDDPLYNTRRAAFAIELTKIYIGGCGITGCLGVPSVQECSPFLMLAMLSGIYIREGTSGRSRS
jgi:hypothetical protein